MEPDPAQSEMMSDLIQQISDASIDTISRADSPLDWAGRQSYHVVVLDVEITADPLDLLEKIKRLSPMTAVVLITSTPSIEQSVSAIRMGAEDYLAKPLSADAFKLAIQRGLDRKSLFHENSAASSFIHLLNSCQLISAALEQDKILGVVASFMSRELGSKHCAFYHDPKGDQNMVKCDFNSEENDPAMQEILDIAVQATSPIEKLQGISDFYRFVDRGQLTPGLFVFKFWCGGKGDYYFVSLSPHKPLVIESFESRLRMLRAQIEVAGKNIDHYMGVRHLVYVDDATGLGNTRFLSTVMDNEVTEYERSGKAFAVLFLDADKFKGVNDQHGHLVGTKLLHELGALIKSHLRGSDSVIRYGGDEFVIVLSPSDLTSAQMVAERIRAAVEVNQFLKDEGLSIHFTVSIGVALFPDHARSKREVLDAADHAMYAAKRKKRNCVFLAELGKTMPVPSPNQKDMKHGSKKA